jgi:ornithine decarboxylase
MKHTRKFWATPTQYLTAQNPDHPIAFFCANTLATTARAFRNGFPGTVTYAVKANPGPAIVKHLHRAGITVFDVASPAEIALVRAANPTATLHYNNPVRSTNELELATRAAVRSFSVDRLSELQKLAKFTDPSKIEATIRLKLPVKAAQYDFGAKFGATPDQAIALLQAARALGFQTSMTFHAGTQCADPAAWVTYIHACANIGATANTPIKRLNVGGGFPSQRAAITPNLTAIFNAISTTTHAAFPTKPPKLLCEPGRAMVAESVTLALRVKAKPDANTLFLNDGLYGGLAEFRDMTANTRTSVITASGDLRAGQTEPFTVFGPTCDSLDTLPEPLSLPATITEGDYILFAGMGAYAAAIATGFNGYGKIETVPVTQFA